MAKKANDIKIKRTEVLYYRMLIVLVALITVVFSVTYLTSDVDGANKFKLETAPLVATVLAVLCVPAVVYYVVSRIKCRDERCSVLSSGYILTLVLWLTSVFALYGKLTDEKRIAYVIVTAALYFVYYLFNREFFIFSLYSAIGAALLVFLNSSTRIMHFVYSALLVLLCALVVTLVLADRKKPVSLKIGKSKLKITDGKFKAYPFCIAAGIMLAGMILSFFSTTAAFYSIVALFACYLVFTVVNTVRMM